jgi:hypothetical protein
LKREALSLCQRPANFIFPSARIQLIPHLSVHPREILVRDILAYSANECRTLTRSISTRKRPLKAPAYFPNPAAHLSSRGFGARDHSDKSAHDVHSHNVAVSTFDMATVS